MLDVCFVLVPYVAIERPSIAMGVLKAALTRVGIRSQVIYGNMQFAEKIGLDPYHWIENSSAAYLCGEWTFSQAAFPDFHPDHSQYFQLIGLNSAKQELLHQVREQAINFIDNLAHQVLELKPRIVSCSSTFQQHCAALAFLRRIRELNPEVITLMGGANCEGPMGVETHRLFPWVDFVLSGEGDESFPQLCTLLLAKGRELTPEELPYGTTSRVSQETPRLPEVPLRATIHHLDSTPIPDYDEYFEALNNSSIRKRIIPGLLVETSRGCWWGQKSHCTFCGLNGSGMTYRAKSTTRVIEEFTKLSELYQTRKLEVVDNILSLNHLEEVLPILAQANPPYEIFYETKANLSRQQIQQLSQSGVRWIQPGIENMHDCVLQLMRKGNNAAINVQTLKWTQEFGVRVSWTILYNFPGELDEWYLEMAEWLPLIFHLQPPTGLSSIRYDRFSPYHENPEKFGIKIRSYQTYAYIYPASEEELVNLAYFFEDATLPKLQTLAVDKNALGFGLKAAQQKVEQWKDLFWSDFRPLLQMETVGQGLKITDTRPCAVQSEIYLEGLAQQIYLLCDRALTSKELIKALRQSYNLTLSWEEIQPIVEQLQQLKILIHLSHRFLSLAVTGDIPPLPTEQDFPGGSILMAETEISKDEKLCLDLIRSLLPEIQLT